MPALSVIFDVAFPVFALVGIGYLAGRTRVMGSEATVALNAFVAAFALPALLFGLLARARMDDIVNRDFIIVMALAMFGSQLAAMALARWWLRLPWIDTVLQGLAAGFGNVGYMGVPICIAGFGPAGALPATLTVVIGAAAMLPLCVVLIELGRHAGRGGRRTVQTVLLAMLRNPLLLAIALGLICAGSETVLPAALQRLVDLLSAAAAPCALFAIGLFLSDKSLAANRREVGLTVAVKLLLQPALAAALVPAFLGFDDMWGRSAVLLAALPSATNAFLLARQYGRFIAETSAAVFLSTLASVLTVSGVLVLLRVGMH